MAKNAAIKGAGKVGKVMQGFKPGMLRPGSAKNIANRRQAVAMALNEPPVAAARVPRKRSPGSG